MRDPNLGLNGRPPYRYEAEKNQAPIENKLAGVRASAEISQENQRITCADN
jgi:hypothetical protein